MRLVAVMPMQQTLWRSSWLRRG